MLYAPVRGVTRTASHLHCFAHIVESAFSAMAGIASSAQPCPLLAREFLHLRVHEHVNVHRGQRARARIPSVLARTFRSWRLTSG